MDIQNFQVKGADSGETIMNYLSTRNPLLSHSLSEAIKQGLAANGGLFIPEFLPKNTSLLEELPYSEFAFQLLKVFYKDDHLAPFLRNICTKTFNFPVPLRQITENTSVLELFHGSTCSFKDFGARFLAENLSCINSCQKTILVATSGDTGAAVASAFYGKNNYKVIILYPTGKISAKQEQQMTCWDENIYSFSVNGNFDQCQNLVKLALQDPICRSMTDLSSANSINIGRLLPQMTYYAYSSLQFARNAKTEAGYIIPSGNLGNATAAYWAKTMGFPIREIILATNENRVISDYLKEGKYNPRASIKTLANAMDVGNPSNFERLNQLFGSFAIFKENVTSFSVDNEKIRQTIDHIYQHYQYICCPHTATAFYARSQLDSKPWIVVATADPCKFDELIEPIINRKVPMALELEKLLAKKHRVNYLEPNLEEFRKLLRMIL